MRKYVVFQKHIIDIHRTAQARYKNNHGDSSRNYHIFHQKNRIGPMTFRHFQAAFVIFEFGDMYLLFMERNNNHKTVLQLVELPSPRNDTALCPSDL